MGIPNSELLALIADAVGDAEHDLVLDPLGIAGGNVFTDYALLLAAVAELEGFVRVFVKSDITISTGSFGDEVSRIDFAGDLGAVALPVLTFDGDATHTAVPRSAELIVFDVLPSATVPPFVPSATLFNRMIVSACTCATGTGGQPLFRLTDPRVLLLVCRSVEFDPDGGVPIVDVAGDAQISMLLQPPSLGSSNIIPDTSIVAASGTTVEIAITEPNSEATHPRDMPGVDAGAAAGYGAFGLSGIVIDQGDISANTTVRRPNSVIKLLVTTFAFTVTIDLSDAFSHQGNFFEFDIDDGGGDFPVTISLAGGDSFAGGGTLKTIQQRFGHWRMVRTGSGDWSFSGPDGVENSIVGPLHVRPELVTLNATPLTLFTRSVGANDQVLGIEAIVSGYSAGTNEQYKYRLTGQAKNILGTVTLVTSTEVIVEDDAAADAVLVVSGTDVVLQITGTAGDTIEWKTEINYTQVR